MFLNASFKRRYGPLAKKSGNRIRVGNFMDSLSSIERTQNSGSSLIYRDNHCAMINISRTRPVENVSVRLAV